jgi:hypothetical protein
MSVCRRNDHGLDETRGLGRWSENDMVAYLRAGDNAFTDAAGPMADEITYSRRRSDGRRRCDLSRRLFSLSRYKR